MSNVLLYEKKKANRLYGSHENDAIEDEVFSYGIGHLLEHRC